MELSYCIMEVLRKNAAPPTGSKGKGPMNRKEIQKNLEKMFPFLQGELRKDSKKLRQSMERLVKLMESQPPESQFLRCVYGDGSWGPVPDDDEEDGGGKRKSRRRIVGYWAQDDLSFRDEEVCFLIDSVMYSSILPEAAARDLARRLQQLRGERLRKITSYVSNGGFGSGRLPVPRDVDLWDNLWQIHEAIINEKRISFKLYVYRYKGGNIVFWSVGERTYTVSPLEVVLVEGRYYLLGVFGKKGEDQSAGRKGKVYSFRVDLMQEIEITKPEAKTRRDLPETAEARGDYRRRYPIMFGGDVRKFRLRCDKDHLTQVVDAFAGRMELLPGTETDTTIDLEVEASEGAMERWLMSRGDFLRAVDPDPNFLEGLQKRIRDLQEKYGG